MSLRSRSVCGVGLAISTILFSTACSDSSGPQLTKPTLAVAVEADSINAAWGSSGTTTANITRGGGYAGTPAMTATGAPAGVTVTFTPATIPAGDTSSTVRVDVADSVAPGTYPIVINAAGSGVSTATATLNLVVVGSFTLGPANPAELTAPDGGAAVTSAIAITRTAPFTGPVALTVTGAPAGMTTSFNPASTTGATSTLSVTADSTVANGVYPLVVRGSGTGVADATIPVAVTVTGGVLNKVVFALNRKEGYVFVPAFVSAVNGTVNPAVDTIPIHGTIRWVGGSNTHSGAHTVRSTGVPSFTGTNTVLTPTGYTVVFNTAGTYTYECGIHGAAMTGTIVVQ